MKRFLHVRPSPAMVVACAALFVALSGVGYTAIVLPANSVGTKHLKKNAVTSPKVKGLLRSDFKPDQLPPRLWAYVSSTGTLRGGRGVVASSRISSGNFRVTFNRSIVNCAATANYLRRAMDSALNVSNHFTIIRSTARVSGLHLELDPGPDHGHPVRPDRGLLSNTTTSARRYAQVSARDMGPPGLEPGTNGL